MKGLLFNVVEDVVTDVLDADAWDDAIENCGASGAYTSLGNYDDGELVGIVGEVAEMADLSVDETVRLAGRDGFAHLAAREPDVIAGYDGWRAVLLSLDDIIHPEVLKLYPGAQVPRFRVIDDGPEMVLEYSSERGLCALADGLIVGCANWFGASVEVRHDSCIHRRDDVCLLRVVESG
ncbi:MAG: heme NO-binding domain-containing protein [Actinomycetota bacterium]